MAYDAKEIIDNLGSLEDDDIDLGLIAIALAVLEQPGISMDRYVHHLKVLSEEVAAKYVEILKDTGTESVDAQLQALSDVIHDEHGYEGDNTSYDDLQNASLIRVIERTKGIPISLSILYICVARKQGWSIEGLNIPGHFVCRIESEGRRIIFDPFNGCKILDASDIRLLVKKTMGDKAELSTQLFEPSSNRNILMRLQNNIKFRLIENEDYTRALEIVQRMLKIDPDAYRLCLDLGVLYAKLEQNGAAIEALEDYMVKVPNAQVYSGETRDAELLLAELRGKLN